MYPVSQPSSPARQGTSPLLGPLQALQGRLDALAEGRVAQPRLVDRVLAPLVPPGALGEVPELTALARELDRIGVHTLADARLLRVLEVRGGRGGGLGEGLERRALQALRELQREVRRAERALLAGQPLPGAASTLAAHLAQLVRVARVADVFRRPEGAPGEEGEGPFLLLPPAAPPAPSPPRSARLAVVELLERRARAEVADVARKRRDLDVAHELLLRMGTELERERTRAVRHAVAEARARAEAMAPVRSVEALAQQVRRRAAREPDAAYRALHGLYTRALEAGDEALARAARAALSPFLPDLATLGAALRGGGPGPTGPVEAAAPRPTAPEGPDGALADLAFRLSAEQRQLLELAAGCARFVDVEEALAETVVEAAAPRPADRARRVPYPTQRMTLATTGSPHDAHGFVLSDPRLVLYDLAAHRQLVRAYLEEEPPAEPRRVRRSSVRVYVCDASGSMYGHRARFRDALLLAELQDIRARARRGAPVDPLYFCFFNDTPTELVRVDSPEEAARQLERLFHASPAEGQTDITLALLTAFDSIRAAQGRDPSLARATVVLVTDGEDRVDLARIREVRAPMTGVSIALSFLSLGEENPDLKALVMEQRAHGERAFYQHLSDDDVQWAHTTFAVPWRTLLPPHLPVRAAELDALLPHLEALEALARGASPRPVRPPDSGFDALFPERSHLPAPPAPVPPAQVGRVADVLEAVLEAAALVPADARAGESAVLLEHLRGVYGLTLPDYLGALASGAARVETALARIRLLCRPLG